VPAVLLSVATMGPAKLMLLAHFLGLASVALGLVQPNASAFPRGSDADATRRLSGSISVATTLLMCNCDGQNCKERYWELPADDWASTCDTLGDLGGSAEVCKFKLTAATSKVVKVAFFTDVYCTGDAVEAQYAWQGQFNANEHGGWYTLQSPGTVRSVRPTVMISRAASMVASSAVMSSIDAGAAAALSAELFSASQLDSGSAGSRQVGVKMVMWPLYNQDAQIGTADEFDCMQGNPGVNMNVNGGGWPQDCVSPVDRVWCVAVHAAPGTAEDWGSLDHLQGLDFADNKQQSRAFDGDSGSGYPMGSVLVNKYTSSWTGHAACASNPNAGLPRGKCVVTKLYGVRCNELTGCESNCNLGAWHSGKELYTLREGQRVNSGGASGPWPVRIRCAWTRVVNC